MSDESTRYILFLDLDKKLPEYYFSLSSFLSDYGISLVPIGSNELRELSLPFMAPIIVVTGNYSSWKSFTSIKRRFLEVAVNNKKYMLFHFSTFSNRDYNFNSASRWGYYYNFKLPVNMELLVEKVVKVSNASWNKVNRWPGGTRVPLDKSISNIEA